MNPGLADRVEAFDRAPQLALHRALVVDVLDEIRDIERRAVEDLEPDPSAPRNPLAGELEPELGNAIGWNRDRRPPRVQPVRDLPGLKLLDDRPGVLGLEVREEHLVAHAVRERHGPPDGAHGQKAGDGHAELLAHSVVDVDV